MASPAVADSSPNRNRDHRPAGGSSPLTSPASQHGSPSGTPCRARTVDEAPVAVMARILNIRLNIVIVRCAASRIRPVLQVPATTRHARPVPRSLESTARVHRADREVRRRKSSRGFANGWNADSRRARTSEGRARAQPVAAFTRRRARSQRDVRSRDGPEGLRSNGCIGGRSPSAP